MKKFILLLPFLLQGCCLTDSFKSDLLGEISLINKSDEDIYFAFTETDKGDFKVFNLVDFDNRLFANSEKEIPFGFRVKVYDNDPMFYNKNYRFYTFIWKKSTIDKYSWEEIQEKNIYDAKLIYTFDELKAMNFLIVYDGK